jgi:hypothetical protein
VSITQRPDGNYNSPTPYREAEFNMYAVLKNDTWALRDAAVAVTRVPARWNLTRVPRPLRFMRRGGVLTSGSSFRRTSGLKSCGDKVAGGLEFFRISGP